MLTRLRTIHISGVALAAAVSLLWSCAQKSEGVKGKPSSKAEDPEEDPDNEEEEESEEPDTSTNEPSLEEILGQCGVTAEDLEDPDAVLMDKQIRSWPKTFAGAQAAPIVGNVNYRVSVVTKIDLKATPSELSQTVDFEITGSPSQAITQAQEKVAPNRGSSTSKVVKMDKRSDLMADNEEWNSVYCTILPIRELSTTKGGTGKVVEFTPALPGSLSPKADPERFAAEIGEQKVFTNIKAEITGSTDPNYPKGKTFTGKVTIKKINPTLVLNINGTGQSQQITADLAYRVTWDFGSVQDTVGIGLMPTQSLYISHSKRDVKVIVADTGFQEGGTVVLSDEL